MSFNQSKGEKSEAHYRKPSRSNNSGNQRSFSGTPGGKGGGGNAPPPQQSSSSLNSSASGNRSFKKSSNGQGGQSRVSVPNSNSQLYVPAARPGQNGAHVQPPLSDAPISGVVAKPTNPSAPRSTRPVPKAPSSQSTIGASDSVAPSTPPKADVAKSSFQLQFGTISPGVVNGMQIPARTSSAPPNLDEQKHDQARHDSFRAAPTVPIPSASKQQQAAKDAGINKQSTSLEPHAASSVAKKDMHPQVTVAPSTTVTQKPSVPKPGMSMPMPFPSQVPVPFGGPNSQIQSQGITTTSLPMPMPLSVGSAAQVPQQVYVPGLQPHPIPTQGMIPQGQSLNFAAQIGHQMPPQMANMGIGISPQFPQQQAGKFVGYRKSSVKITHPDTHEELRLDKRTDSYMDSGSSGPRSHPNVPPQSQPMPSFAPHQINYYPPMQTSSYNPASIFYPTPQPAVPLTSTQMTTGPQATRYSYPVVQGSPAISFKNPSTLNPLPATKIGPPLHSAAEPLKVEYPHDAQGVTSSLLLPPIQVTVKPAPSMGEKVGTSSVTISSPVVSKGESPKLLRAPREAIQKDSDIGSGNSYQQSKSVHESAASFPSLVTVKHSTAASGTVSAQRLPTSISTSASASPSEDSASVITEGRQRETVRKSESFKDRQKKVVRKDTRNSQLQNKALVQEAATNPTGTSKSSSPRMSRDLARGSDSMQSPPSETVASSPSIVSFPSQDVLHSSSLKDGNLVEGLASIGTSGGSLVSSGEPLPDACVSSDASEPVTDGMCHDDGDISCSSLNKIDLQSEGTISDNLDVSQHAKQDLVQVQLKQEHRETVEGKTVLSEGVKQDTKNSEMPTESIHLESLEGDKQIGIDSGVKETTVIKESGSVGSEQKNEGSMDRCSSEVEKIVDNLMMSATTSSGSVDAETAPSSCVSSTSSEDDKTLNLGTSPCSTDRANSQDVSVICSARLNQDSHTDSTTVSSDVTLQHEPKSTDIASGGLVSVSGSKDKPTSETNKAKSTNPKVKKRRKDILKAADAAGSTSDLYMAYKGPEEKQENAVASENMNSSFTVDVKQATADTEKDVTTAEEVVQTKVEPDDWEDAADISTPKLKNSGVGKQGRAGSVGHTEDGITSKKYSRDFLLTLSEQCTDLPADFEIGSDIAESIMSVQVGISHLVDREMYPNAGRGIDRQSGGPRPERRGSGMLDEDKWNKSPGPFVSGRDPRLEGVHGGAVAGFRPGQVGNHGVLRNPRGQYIGGILSGPMQSGASQGVMQRINSDADRWQRAAGYQKGLIPSPQTPSQTMHKAEKKYEIREVSDIEEAKQRKLKAILNKLTPQNFEKLFEQVKDVNIDNAVTLIGVISQIFDKALMEPTFCEMYANFCSHLAGELPDFSEDNEKITFKRLLLNKCQEEFERGEREQAEANRVEEEGEIKCSEEVREEKRIQARRRMLGNIRLIGELYKKRMLTERIMHECIKKLLGQHQNPDEEDVEALCKLMSTIGEMIDHPKAKEHMDAYFDTMTNFSNNMKLSSRVRFMLKDSIDLRRNKWQQRRKVEGPKKIDEVHRDAAQERHAQSTRLSRGPSMGSSARRGQPMDFGPRGSNVSPSPNSQMGGLRGYQPQVRGYGQDVRMEERHSYESRTLSVPLSQRPFDDNSITLGPQGGLARGMSVRGQPLMSGVPLVDIPPGDPRRFAAGPNGYSSPSEWTPYAREEVLPRYAPERSMAMHAYDQSNTQERSTHLGNRDLRSTDRSLDRSTTSSAPTVQGASSASPAHAAPEKVWPEERLRDMSISAIREFYSAKDKEEVASCIKDLNSPSFYPAMVSIWVTDSFERKDMERDLLAKLLVDLTLGASLLSQFELIKGFESVLSTLEDAVNDAPKAAEFLGRILAKVILENVVPLRDIGQLIHEGGEEPGRLLKVGLASEVLGSILEIIRSEKGESVLNEIRRSSSLRLEDFRPPDPIKSRKLEAFF